MAFQLSDNLSIKSVSRCILSQFYLAITAVWEKKKEEEKEKNRKPMVEGTWKEDRQAGRLQKDIVPG